MNDAENRLARWDRPLAAVLLGLPALVLVACTFASNGATRIYSWPWAFYLQAALLAPWLWCAWSAARGRTGLREGWWISLPLLGALLLSILTSAHRHAAVEASLVLATPLVLLPFLGQIWADAAPATRLMILRCVGAVLALLAVVSITRCLAGAPESGVISWFFVQRNPHPLGHSNLTGGLALVALLATCLLAWRERGVARTIWILAAAVSVVQLISTGSRGTGLGLLAALVLVAAALAARHRWSARAIAGGVAVIVAAGALTIATNPRLRQAIGDPASTLTHGESEQQRLGFILTGLRIGMAHPWTGIGPGTTPYHYPEHRVDLPGSLENSFQLHCGPLQWWVDTGFAGLAALGFAGGFLKLRAWRARRSLTDEAVAVIALLGGYGMLWLTDHQLDVPIFPAWLALGGAMFLAETGAPVSRDKHATGARPISVLLVAIPVIAAAFLSGSWRARAAFASAWHAKDTNDPNAFIKHLRAAAELAPWNPSHPNHFARALAGIATHLPPETAAALRAEARRAWQASLAASPAQDHPWLNLGWLALAEDRASEAGGYFARAAEIQPRRTGLWYATALARVRLGEPEAAAIALAREVRLDPAFITSPVWRDEPVAGLRPQVLALLAEGWPRREADPGAGGDTGIAAFAQWWWTGEVVPGASGAASSRTLTFLGEFDSINDRSVAALPVALPPGLNALREHWRTRAVIDPALVAPDVAAGWASHVQAHRGDAFTLLLKTFPATATRRVQRGADGILFRQTDGDPLSDLTEIPSTPLAGLLAPVMPRPAVREFFEHD